MMQWYSYKKGQEGVITMTQGERVKEIRKNLGLTLEKFGNRLGVGKTAISKIEKGEKIMFSLFKKEKFKIVSPLDGQLILLKDVPDSVFSQKLMGDGFAIIPQSQVVVSPISGVAESVFPTGHAVGIKTKDGIECIVHIGLDTVELNGEGFTSLISQGDYVKAGEPIVQFDNQFIKDKGYNLTTMVVFPSGYEKDFNLGEREVKKGEVLF